jgi:hypothetical protein
MLVALACVPAVSSAQVQRTFVNLGFEQPALTGNNCYLIISAGVVPGWDTNHPANTVSGSCALAGSPVGSPIAGPIEVWRGPNYLSVPPRSGSQHAELNAYVASRLSQTICLTNNERVDWRLSHRGRNSATVPEVMNFNVDSTANTVAVLSSTTTGTGAPVSCPSGGTVTSHSCTSAAGGNGWTDYSGSFTWTGTTGNHNFGFQAIGGGATGNLLDDIQVTLRPYLEFDPNASASREGSATPTLPQVRIRGTVPAGGITVLVDITGGTATAGSDYTTGASANVTIPAGVYDDQRFPIPINIVDDSVIEDNETVTFQVRSNPTQYSLASTSGCGTAPNAAGTLTILDNDVDLQVTKALAGGANPTPPAGGATQFTVTYRNNTARTSVADTTSHDVIATVLDPAPAGLSFGNWSCQGGNGGACNASGGSGPINTTALLPAGSGGAAGGFVTYTINATVDAQRCAAMTNSASAAVTGALAEGATAQSGFVTPVPAGMANNSANALVDPACVALSMVKSELGDLDAYTPGTTSTYTLHACNAAGSDPADGATIGDSLPPGVSLASAWTCSGSGGGTCPASGGAAGGTSVSVVGVVLPAGACVDVSIPVRFSSNPSDYVP